MKRTVRIALAIILPVAFLVGFVFLMTRTVQTFRAADPQATAELAAEYVAPAADALRMYREPPDPATTERQRAAIARWREGMGGPAISPRRVTASPP